MNDLLGYQYENTILYFDNNPKIHSNITLPCGMEIVITSSFTDILAIPAVMIFLPYDEVSEEYFLVRSASPEGTILIDSKEGEGLDVKSYVLKELKIHSKIIVKAKFRELFKLKKKVIEHPERFVFLDIEPTSLKQARLIYEIKFMNARKEILFEARSSENASEEVKRIVGEKEIDVLSLHEIMLCFRKYTKDKIVITYLLILDMPSIINSMNKVKIFTPMPQMIDIDAMLSSIVKEKKLIKNIKNEIGRFSDLKVLIEMIISDEEQLLDKLDKLYSQVITEIMEGVSDD